MMESIYVLLSIDNDYDQPPANLVAWWKNKPSFLELANALNIEVDLKEGNDKVGRIIKGELNVRYNNTDYRLENIEEGKYFEHRGIYD